MRKTPGVINYFSGARARVDFAKTRLRKQQCLKYHPSGAAAGSVSDKRPSKGSSGAPKEGEKVAEVSTHLLIK